MLPSKEELMATPLTILRNSMTSRIESQAEEKLLQDIIVQRMSQRSAAQVIQDSILSKEDADFLKGKIDEKVNQISGSIMPEPEEEESSKTTTVPTLETKVKFCDFCDSKGGRHKLNCTRERK